MISKFTSRVPEAVKFVNFLYQYRSTEDNV
jgi:hypothetical protein